MINYVLDPVTHKAVLVNGDHFTQSDINNFAPPPPKPLISLKQYGQIGGAIGSSLGNYLAHGDKVMGIVYSSVLGTIGKDLALGIANGLKTDSNIGNSITTQFNHFGTQLNLQVGQAVTGAAASILVTQLLKDLGIKGFGGELLSSVGTDVLTSVLNGAQAGGGTFTSILENGWDPKAIFNATNWSNAIKGVPGDIAAFFGAKLGNLILQPQTQAEAILGSLGSTIGTILGTPGGPIGMFIGSFVGDIIGTLIGSLFGHKKPKVPSAGAETVLNLPKAEYILGAVTSSNGGSTDIVVQMAQVAAQTLNGLIAEATGDGLTTHFVSNSSSPTQTYGYTGSQLYVKLAGTQYNFSSADQAVDKGVVWALPQTQIIGGDIFVKRAFKNSAATDILGLVGDVQIAKEYGAYVTNRALIDSFISSAYGSLSQAEQDFYTANKVMIDKVDMSGISALSSSELSTYNGTTMVVGTGSTQTLATAQDIANGNAHTTSTAQIINDVVAALQSQGSANPWIITLARANELGLNNWSSSDFYGGIGGFLQSFGLGLAGSTARFEDIKLIWDTSNSSNLKLTITDSKAPGLFSILPQATNNGTSVTINNFTTVMGYVSAAMGTYTGTSSANYIESAASATSAVTFNDSSPSRGTGYNILIGGDHNNTITAGANDTWIQGGAGTDILTGSTGHDVIIAGSGNTTIYGGDAGYYGSDTAGSYLAAGSGTDHIYGGAKNDTIVLGGGVDTIAAGGGDDTIVLNGTGGSGSMDGGTGSNTVSFERYASGISVSLGAWASGSGSAYTISNIQNLIGSAAGHNTLTAAGTGGILEGGAGNDTFNGVGTTTVTFANSGGSVFVDLLDNVSIGGSANGDVFNNIRNLIGSGFDDELEGVVGSTLDGGTGGNDWFDFSGGGNTYKGSVTGFNTLDYGLAAAAVTINLTNDLNATGGTGQVTGYAQDKLFNIIKIYGSTHGSTVTGLPSMTQTLDANGNVISTSASNLGMYFVAGGGANTLALGGYDTVELGIGGGQSTVTSGFAETLLFAPGMSYDNLWLNYTSIVRNRTDVEGFRHYLSYSSSVTLNMRGLPDNVTYKSTRSTLFAMLSSINMGGASTLDLTGITQIIGASTTTESGDDDPGDSVCHHHSRWGLGAARRDG